MQEHFIGLDNYKAILTSQEFWKVLKNTLTYIVLYLPLMMAVSLAVASLLSQQRRGVGVFRVLYYIPVLTSWVAASLIWKSILAPQYGAMNNILAFFGIEGPGWLLDEKMGDARNRVGVRMERHGLLWPDSSVRYGWHQPNLL